MSFFLFFFFLRTMIPPEAIALLFYISIMFSFFTVRGEQMLTDGISLADSFVSDA